MKSLRKCYLIKKYDVKYFLSITAWGEVINTSLIIEVKSEEKSHYLKSMKVNFPIKEYNVRWRTTYTGNLSTFENNVPL